MLAGGNFVVLGFCGNSQLPKLVIELFHEVVNGGTYGAKVMVVKLLSLRRLASKERTPTQNQIGTLLKILLTDEKILLLRTNICHDALGSLAKKRKYTFCVAFKGKL